MIKSLLPKSLKLLVRLGMNLMKDIANGYYFMYAKKRTIERRYTHKIVLTQPLRPNEAKLHNLKIAIKSIETVEVLPNEVFSFWKLLGKPSKKNGFKKSRSIVENKIEKSIGGGLCQLSGLIYYASLHTDLEILERHNHSIDIYNDETRFTPLGSDSTVAYGYKDLKIRNHSNQPVRFTFIIDKTNLMIELNHFGALQSKKVEFQQRSMDAFKVEVDTIIDNIVINTSTYKTLCEA